MEVRAAGRQWPETVPAAQANVAGDELVVGIVVEGVPRAYLMSALEPRPGEQVGSLDAFRDQIANHVVNDLVGETPVTVTHCDRTACTRVLTDATAASPLGIGVWGWKDGDMQLLINGQRMPHQSSQLPLDELPHVVVPWEDWSYLYPDTDVYIGG